MSAKVYILIKLMGPVSFNDAAIVAVKGNDYRINFTFMTKSEAVDRMENADSRMENADSSEKGRQLL